MSVESTILDHMYALEPIERSFIMADGYWAVQNLIESSHSFTIMNGDVIIAIVGFREIWPGVIDIWDFPSIHIPQYSILFFRSLWSLMKTVEDFHPMHRMQAVALKDERHDKYMTRFGFKNEGVLRQYSSDRLDYVMWGKVYE